MTDQTFLSGQALNKIYGVSSSSLRAWENRGKITAIRTPGGKRLYSTNDVSKLFAANPESTAKHNIIQKEKAIYARVSSDHQKEDLKRQIELLTSKYPDHKVYQDVASGLNWKRKNFLNCFYIKEWLYATLINMTKV